MSTDLFKKTPPPHCLIGRRTRLLLSVLPILICSLSSPGATVTWKGSISSDWFTAGNWSPSGVPASSDTINFTNGTINLTAPVSIGGVFNWSAGVLGGDAMTIKSGGAMNIQGNVSLENVLTNAGTVTITGTAYILVYNNEGPYFGGVYNLAGALLDIQTNANIQSAGYGHEFFDNAGNFRRSLGTSTAVVGVSFTNSGTVTNLTNSLDFNSGGMLAGSFDIASGASIYFNGGNFTMGVPPVVSGPGLCEFSGSMLTLTKTAPNNILLANGNLALGSAFQNSGAITNLTVNGVTLLGTNSVTGAMDWAGGVISGPMTVKSGGLLNIGGNVSLENVLTNAGTVTMTGTAYMTVYNDDGPYFGGVYNLAGALWDIQTNADIVSAGYGHEFFDNVGNFRRSLGTAAVIVGVNFTNSGTVTNLQSGLYFNAGGTLTGTYDTAAGAATYFNSGNFTMGVPPVVSGSGLCEFSGSMLTLTETAPNNILLANGNLALGPAFQNSGAITNLTLNGATLLGTNSVTGTMDWAAGVISGPMTVKSGGLLNIEGNVSLENVLTNAGTVTMTGTAYMNVYNDDGPYFGGVYNLAGALWDIQTNANIVSVGYGHEFFDNAGNFRRSLGTSAVVVSVNFTNSGTVTNLTNSLDFNGGGALTGTYDTAAGAATYFNSGNFTMGALPLITGPGICEFTGTMLTLAQNVPPNLLLGSGNLALGPAFQNSGAITNLTLNGVTLLGTNSVTGTMDWAGGLIPGPMTVKSGGLLNIEGDVSLENVLTNAGTVTMTGTAYMNVYNDDGPYFGGVYNLAGALWDIQTNANIVSVGYGHEFFDNAGNFRRSLGTSPVVVSVNFTNSGTVTNLTNSLDFNGGGALTGTYDTAAGAATYFNAGNFTMGALPLITGLGICEFTGTMLTLAQNVPPNLLLAGGNLVLGPAFQNSGAITNLTIKGTTLLGTNSVTGTMDWASGAIPGPMTVKSGGLLNIEGDVSLENVLTNAGTVTMTGAAYLDVYNDDGPYFGGVYNLAGALWDIQTNAYIETAGYGHEFFDNAGNFRRSLGTSTAVVGVSFTNSGTVAGLASTLEFNGSFTIDGGAFAFGVSGPLAPAPIDITGAVALSGPASVSWLDGFVPAISNTVNLLEYGLHIGTFSPINLPAGTTAEEQYGATIFSLLVTAASPSTNQPVLSIQRASAGSVMVLWPASATNFTLQTTSNLSAKWTNVVIGIAIEGTNSTVTTPTSGHDAFFRLEAP